MNELGTQLVDEGHPNAEEIQKTTETVNSRYIHIDIVACVRVFCGENRCLHCVVVFLEDFHEK